MTLIQKSLVVIFLVLIIMLFVAIFPTPKTVFIGISLVSILGIVQTILVLKKE